MKRELKQNMKRKHGVSKLPKLRRSCAALSSDVLLAPGLSGGHIGDEAVAGLGSDSPLGDRGLVQS